MANIESHPEGFNALRRMYENFHEPLMDAAAGQASNQQDPLAALLGAAAPAGNASAGESFMDWHCIFQYDQCMLCLHGRLSNCACLSI